MADRKIIGGAALPVWATNTRARMGGAALPVALIDPVTGDFAELLDAEQANAISNFGKGVLMSEPTLTVTTPLVSGVAVVRLGYDALKVNLDGDWYDLPSGSIDLNSADVALPTNRYIYIKLTNGAPVVVSSSLDPEMDPSVNYVYAWLSIVRFDSNAGTANVYFVRRAYTNLELLAHFAGEYDFYSNPVWIDGGGITINATTGTVDMEALEYRRLRFDGEELAVTAGTMLVDGEAATVSNLEQITTYADGSSVTAGKYIKLLFGAILSLYLGAPFMVMRQEKPAIEYATLDAAIIDAERKAAQAWPLSYRGGVFPLAYVVMKVGDASDLTTVDLRATGVTGSGGGGSAVTDHGSLTGLGDDDHLQYLLADGTRTITGDMAVVAGMKIDGVDISTHAHTGVDSTAVSHANLTNVTANQHHNQAHVLATTAGLGADHTVSGLTAGQVLRATGATTAAMQALQASDIPSLTASGISDFNEAAQDAVGNILVSTQDIVPTYNDVANTISWLFSTTGQTSVTLANGANHNVNIGTALLVNVTGPTGSFNITGFTGGYPGRKLFVFNTTAQNMLIEDQNVGSTAANRVNGFGITSGNRTTSGTGIMQFIYCGLSSRWLFVGINS